MCNPGDRMCTRATRLSAASLYTHQNSNEEGNLLVAEIREVISISGILLHARLDCVSMCSGMVFSRVTCIFRDNVTSCRKAKAPFPPPSCLVDIGVTELRARIPWGSHKDSGGNHLTPPQSNPVVATREAPLSSLSSLCQQPHRRCGASAVIAAVKSAHLGVVSGPPGVDTSSQSSTCDGTHGAAATVRMATFMAMGGI